MGKVSISSKQLKSYGVLVLFQQIPRPCLLLGSTPSAVVASTAKAIVGQPDQCLGLDEHSQCMCAYVKGTLEVQGLLG